MKKKLNYILVTGAGKGIGYATVKLLLKKGFYVYALIKNTKDNKKFKNLKNLEIINGNVNDSTLIKNIFIKSNKKNNIITGLVNNAGIRQRKKFLDLKKEEIQNIFDTNFFSVFNLMQIFANNLIKKKIGGSVVNISSIVGKKGFSELSGYGSTKGALNSLTKCFAVEMAKYQIRANSINPGFTETSYFRKFKKKKNLYKWTLNRTPLSRWAKSEEISEVIIFLLSNKSSYITGEDINVDGGWLSS